MTPSSKCVSLETAKRLQAAGFPQDTERWWMFNGKVRNPDYKLGGWKKVNTFVDISAPDAIEIANLLPVSKLLYKLTLKEIADEYVGEVKKMWCFKVYLRHSPSGKGILGGTRIVEGRNESMTEAFAEIYLYLASEKKYNYEKDAHL